MGERGKNRERKQKKGRKQKKERKLRKERKFLCCFPRFVFFIFLDVFRYFFFLFISVFGINSEKMSKNVF